MYPQISTIATACDGIIECFEGTTDNCDTDSITTPILVGAIILILLLYFGLKTITWTSTKTKIKLRKTKSQFDEELIQQLRENPGDQENNRKINLYLLHILDTNETEFRKVFLIKFYDVLETALENKGEEVFCYLKRNIHPDVTKDIVEHKFRGLVTKVNDFIV